MTPTVIMLFGIIFNLPMNFVIVGIDFNVGIMTVTNMFVSLQPYKSSLNICIMIMLAHVTVLSVRSTTHICVSGDTLTELQLNMHVSIVQEQTDHAYRNNQPYSKARHSDKC